MKNAVYTSIPYTDESKPRILVRRYQLSSGRNGISFRTRFVLLTVLSLASVILSHSFLSEQITLSPKLSIISDETIQLYLQVENASRSTKPLTPVSVNNGTALVCACRNRHGDVVRVLKSWMMFPEITQIIIVDWSSESALYFAVEELDRNPKLEYPHITILRVLDQTSWSYSRAYNIAFRYATAPNILSVPCGTLLRRSFFSKHDLTPGVYFSGSHDLERSHEEYGFQTILYAFRSSLHGVGGYDERIASKSGIREDHIDLLRRLSYKNLVQNAIDYDQVVEILGVDPVAVFPATQHESDLNYIEADVNMRLLTGFPVWNGTASDKAFLEDVSNRLITPSFRHQRVHYVSINSTSSYQPIRQLVSEDRIATSRKGAITVYMQRVYDVPECLTRILPLPQRTGLLQSLADKMERGLAKPRGLFMLASGNLAERLVLLASSYSFCAHTGRSLFVFWPRIPEVAERFTSLSALFTDPLASAFVIENLDEKMLTENACPASGTIDNTTAIFTFSDEYTQQPQPPIPGNIGIPHIIVQGTSFIRSEVLRFSNLKTIRAELKKILSIPVNEDIANRLRGVNQEQLSHAVGIHVPQVSLTSNHSQNLQYFSAVHQELSNSTSTFPKSLSIPTTVYMSADWKFVQRFKHLGLKLLPTLRAPSECEQKERCFYAQLLQIKALTKTAKFFSPANDSLANFIRMYRDDDATDSTNSG